MKCSSPTKAHWYVYPEPNGPTSLGVCKYCGAKNEAPNWQDRNLWDPRRTAAERAKINAKNAKQPKNRDGRFNRNKVREAQ